MNQHAYRDCRDLIVKEYQAIYGAQSWYKLLDSHPFGLDAVKEALEKIAKFTVDGGFK